MQPFNKVWRERISNEQKRGALRNKEVHSLYRGTNYYDELVLVKDSLRHAVKLAFPKKAMRYVWLRMLWKRPLL